MPCHRVRVGDGWGIVCTTGRQRLPLCSCGAVGELECDWKIGDGKTCDRPICLSCTVRPAPKKDLCPKHALAWKAWKAERVAAS